METITVPRQEFEMMKEEIKVLRNTHIYKRLLEFEADIAQGHKFTRKDLGF